MKFFRKKKEPSELEKFGVELKQLKAKLVDFEQQIVLKKGLPFLKSHTHSKGDLLESPQLEDIQNRVAKVLKFMNEKLKQGQIIFYSLHQEMMVEIEKTYADLYEKIYSRGSTRAETWQKQMNQFKKLFQSIEDPDWS